MTDDSLFSTRKAFDLYIRYNALKRHFTSDYDFFKYQGKIKASPQAFETRKDKYQFYKLSKKRDAENILLANIVNDPNIWIGNLSDEVYTKWLKRKQAFTNHVRDQLSEIENLQDEICVRDGNYPKLLHRYIRGDISLETLIALDSVINFLSSWNKKIIDPVVWCNIYKLCRKYKPFLEYDQEAIRRVIVDSI